MTTHANKMSDEELECALMDLFCKTEQFALEFLGGKTSKEDFSNNNAAGKTLDHQQAAHIAMQLIKQHLQAYTDEIRRELLKYEDVKPGTYYGKTDTIERNGLRSDQRQALKNLATKWGVK